MSIKPVSLKHEKSRDWEVATKIVEVDAFRIRVVDHKQSAVNNLKAAARGLVDTLDPTSSFRFHLRDRAIIKASAKSGAYVVPTPAWLWIPAAVLLKIYQPFGVLKDVADAALHGTLAGVEALFPPK